MAKQRFPVGRHTSAPVRFNEDAFGGFISFDVSSHLDPDVVVNIEVWLSNDNGQTWDFGGSVRRRGGIGRHPITGEPHTTAWFGSYIGAPSYTPDDKFDGYKPKWKRPLMRTVMTVEGGEIETEISHDIVRSVRAQGDVPDRHHSIGVVQSVSAFAGNAISCTTAGITTTNGNLVSLDSVFYDQSTTTISVYSDSNSNVWTESVARRAATVVFSQGGYNENIAGGSGHTFTCTLNPGNVTPYPTLAVTEISGHASSPLDKTGTVDDNPTTGTPGGSGGFDHETSSTGTLSQARELLLGCGGVGQPDTGTVSAPWTQLENISHDGNREGIVTAWQVVNSTDAVTFKWHTAGQIYAPGHITTWKEAATDDLMGQAVM